MRFECGSNVKVPSTISFIVNGLRLSGLRLKLGGHNF